MASLKLIWQCMFAPRLIKIYGERGHEVRILHIIAVWTSMLRLADDGVPAIDGLHRS